MRHFIAPVISKGCADDKCCALVHTALGFICQTAYGFPVSQAITQGVGFIVYIPCQLKLDKRLHLHAFYHIFRGGQRCGQKLKTDTACLTVQKVAGDHIAERIVL